MKNLFAALVLLIPSFATAGLINGSLATFQADPGIFGPQTVTLVSGVDLTSINFQFDFNAGLGADVFSWISTPLAGDLAGSTSVTLSSMNFAGGASLTGFTLFSTVLSNLAWSTTADSITFSYTSTGFVGPGSILSGQYSVPEPGTLALFGLALLSLGAIRRKRTD